MKNVIIVVLISFFIAQIGKAQKHWNLGDTVRIDKYGHVWKQYFDHICPEPYAKEIKTITYKQALEIIKNLEKNGTGYKAGYYEYCGNYQQWLDIDREMYLKTLNNIKSNIAPGNNAPNNIGFSSFFYTLKPKTSKYINGKLQVDILYVFSEPTKNGTTKLGFISDFYIFERYFERTHRKTEDRRALEKEMVEYRDYGDCEKNIDPGFYISY
jgi:hypothetical protein